MSTTFFHFVEFFGAEEAGDLCHEGGVGLAAGRAEQQVGVAVVRNRVKRRLRECVRPLLPEMKNGLYVFVARPSAAECSYEKLNASVRSLVKKLDAVKPGTGEVKAP